MLSFKAFADGNDGFETGSREFAVSECCSLYDW